MCFESLPLGTPLSIPYVKKSLEPHGKPLCPKRLTPSNFAALNELSRACFQIGMTE
jgi:hypothetical protein